MTEYTAEIIKIEFGHLLSAISAWMPALEGISKSNLEANAATSQVAQSISEWNLPGQFELLNAQLSEAFALQQETMQALLDMMEKVRAERGVRLSTGGAWYKNSIQNGLFHIGIEMPKGGVRQSRTVALATSGQKYNSISLFTYHVSLSMKGGMKRDAARECSLKNFL